jgi:anti-sigma B factor antagonist
MTGDRAAAEVTSPQVSTRSLGDDAVEIAVRGDLDIETGGLLQEALESCFEDDAIRTLSLDLGDATFIDSAGLRVLLRARRAALMTGRGLVLASPSRAVVRLLEVTGIDRLFDLVQARQRM